MTRLLRILPVVAAVAALLATSAAAYKVDRTPPPDGFVGVPYTFTFKAEGGTAPHTFKLDSGALPVGLSLSSGGVVSGTPSGAGSASFYIQATDSFGLKSEVQFTINIGQKLTVSTNSLPIGTVGVPYNVGLSTSGGSANSWTITAGSLPGGISLAGNQLQGTPTGIGSSTFTVSATNGSQTDTKQLTLTVRAPLAVSTSAMPPAVTGQPFTAQFSASGGYGAYSYYVAGGALPAGLTLDGSTGVIDGTPRTAGKYTVQLSVSASGGGAAQVPITLVVRRQVSILTSSLPVGKVGARYTGFISVVGGVAPVSLSSTSVFPPGVQLNAENGRLTGRPTKAGTYRVTVVASDSYGGSTIRRLVIRVR